MTPAQRKLRATLAVHTSWANTEDRVARTAPARAGFEARFDRMVVEKFGELPPAEHAKRAASFRAAYFADIQFKSARARAKRAGKA